MSSSMSFTGDGILKLITGCMKSGKTTDMIFELIKYTSTGQRVLLINHKLNTRTFISRNPLIKALQEVKLLDTVNSSDLKSVDVKVYNAIGVDEGQFFDDLDTTIKWANSGKDVIIAALSGDYKQVPFPSVVKILAYAEVKHLYGACDDCLVETKGKNVKKAWVTYKTTKGSDLIEIGDSQYLALCLKHLASRSAKPQPTSSSQ